MVSVFINPGLTNMEEPLYGIKRNIRFSAFSWSFSIRLIMHGMKIKITVITVYSNI
jgi:hypothetical protein